MTRGNRDHRILLLYLRDLLGKCSWLAKDHFSTQTMTPTHVMENRNSRENWSNSRWMNVSECWSLWRPPKYVDINIVSLEILQPMNLHSLGWFTINIWYQREKQNILPVKLIADSLTHGLDWWIIRVELAQLLNPSFSPPQNNFGIDHQQFTYEKLMTMLWQTLGQDIRYLKCFRNILESNCMIIKSIPGWNDSLLLCAWSMHEKLESLWF